MNVYYHQITKTHSEIKKNPYLYYDFLNSPSVIKFHNFENFCYITKSKIDEDQKEDFLNLAQKLIDSLCLASKIFDNSDTEISIWRQGAKKIVMTFVDKCQLICNLKFEIYFSQFTAGLTND